MWGAVRAGALGLTLVIGVAQPLIGAATTRGAGIAGLTIDDRIAQMTLREKVGQLFISRLYGSTANDSRPAVVAANRKYLGVDNAEVLIAKYHVGGIAYFAYTKNIENPTQVARLSNQIQAKATSRHSPVPLLLSTDQEGGTVVRLGPPAAQFPGGMPLGAARDSDLARQAGSVTGTELRAVGINQALAPVADVNVNPDNPVIGVRSFGSKASLVASLTAAEVDGLQGPNGVAATAKHFPGHGDTDVDSHTGVPIIHHTKAQWWAIDEPPFKAAVDAGVDVIMTAHIEVPALDPSDRPATLSKPILTGILRNKLGFRGVIMTDSLGMAGVRKQYGDAQVPVLALKAGVDLLVTPPNLPVAYNAVLNAVENGTLKESRIDQSLRRILALKQKLGLFANSQVDVGAIGSKVGTPAHRAVAQRVANQSVTLVKNHGGLLPLDLSGKRVLVTGVDWFSSGRLPAELDALGASVTAHWTGYNPSDATIQATVQAADSRDVVIVLTYRSGIGSRQAALVKALVHGSTPVIAVAIAEPYDIRSYAGVPTYLATYSPSAVSIHALARIIGGDLDPTGRLPVSIPRSGGGTLFPFGQGLGY